MEGKSSAVAVYFKPVVSGPKKSLHLNSIYHVATVKFPTPSLEQCCRIFLETQEAVAAALMQFNISQEALVGVYTHDVHGLDERVQRPMVLTTLDFASKKSPDGFSEDGHVSSCKGCRWFDDFWTTKIDEDDYAKLSRSITLCALSRVSLIDEVNLRAEVDIPNCERTVSPSTTKLSTNLLVDEQPLVNEDHTDTEMPDASQELPMAQQNLSPEAVADRFLVNLTDDELVKLLNDPNSKFGARVKGLISALAVANMQGPSGQIDVTNPAKTYQVSRLEESKVSGSAPPSLEASSESHQSFAIDAELISKQLDSTSGTPFTEEDLPGPERSEQHKVDYGTMFGKSNRRQIEQSEDSDSSTNSAKTETVEYDSDTIIVSQPEKIVKKLDYVKVPSRPRGLSPKRVFEELAETGSQSSYMDDTDMTEESWTVENDEDNDDDVRGWQSKISRSKRTRTNRANRASATVTGDSESSTIDHEGSSTDSDSLQELRRGRRESSSASARIQQKGTLSRKSAKNGISKPLALQTKTTNGAPLRSLMASLSPKSPANNGANEKRGQLRTPAAPTALMMSGRKSRQPKTEEIDAIKISRDGDRIVDHRLTPKGYIKYQLQWNPDQPGWHPAKSWIPERKFEEDPYFIEDYKRGSKFKARQNQAKDEVKSEKTWKAVQELKNPKRRF